jgi:hypothetical protein
MEAPNSITVKLPEYQWVVKGNLDGKDNPVMQGGQATRITNAFTKTGPNTLNVTTKLNGKVLPRTSRTRSSR